MAKKKPIDVRTFTAELDMWRSADNFYVLACSRFVRVLPSIVMHRWFRGIAQLWPKSRRGIEYKRRVRLTIEVLSEEETK